MSDPGASTDVPGRQSRAWGEAVTGGVARSSPADFIVEEDLGFSPDGGRAHTLLHVRKTAANTDWAARCIARAAGVHVRDIGFCGLKDRQAVTSQWFSVPGHPSIDSNALAQAGLEVLQRSAHGRKLRRGSHRGNRFRIVLVSVDGIPAAIEQRLSAISAGGVPNYFGPQRFGRQGNNLALARALSGGARLERRRRGFALSAARAAIFNSVLSRRVATGRWNLMIKGDVAVLDGTASWFPVSQPDEAMMARTLAMDLHPSGPLWGRGDPATTDTPHELEIGVANGLPDFCKCVEQAGMKQERRALRLPVRNLEWDLTGDRLEMSFYLPRGAFATAVLAEILAD
jgi:tRNA pseudouridine13 synthase